MVLKTFFSRRVAGSETFLTCVLSTCSGRSSGDELAMFWSVYTSMSSAHSRFSRAAGPSVSQTQQCRKHLIEETLDGLNSRICC